MWPVIIILLFVPSYSHAEHKITDPFSDVDAQMAKISSNCLTFTDYEAMSGNILPKSSAKWLARSLLEQCMETIGIQEIRKVLNFQPAGPWKHYNATDPSQEELDNATIEEYYNLKEPQNRDRSLSSRKLYEHHVHTCVAYLDKRLPNIRAIYRNVFRLSVPRVMDKEGVDHMVHVLEKMMDKFFDLSLKMLDFRKDCPYY